MNPLQQLLQTYRQAAQTERGKGTYFERLTLDFLKADAVFAPQFTEVLTFADWAAKYEPSQINGHTTPLKTGGANVQTQLA